MPIHILDEMNKFLETYTVKAGSDLKQRKARESVIEVFATNKTNKQKITKSGN